MDEMPPINTPPEVPWDALLDPKTPENREIVEQFSKELKAWWWRENNPPITAEFKRSDKLMMKFSGKAMQVNPQFANWLIKHAAHKDETVWKHVHKAILAGKAFATKG